MARRREQKPRGLPSLADARAERRRAIVGGKVRVRAMPPQFWLWAFLAFGVISVVYWKFSQGKLEGQKSAVMAKQRAMAKTLGLKLLPLRDQVESFAQTLSKGAVRDEVADGTRYQALAKAPSVYLRLRQENAQSPEVIRKAAVRSLHDGFTSCFFIRDKVQSPVVGKVCQSSADCASGELCNEYDHCGPPPEPFNMRLAYRSLRVLSSAWTDELHQAESELAVLAYERDLDRVTQEDVPIAAKILARAKNFVLVLDEDPPTGLPETNVDQDAGGYESEEERVQRVPHFVRVGVWELASGKQLLKVRRRAEGRVVPVGKQVVTRPESVNAQQRQAVSCALALELKTLLNSDSEPPTAAEAPDGGADAGAPDGGSP